MTHLGQIERLLPLGCSARYLIRQETFAGTPGNGRDAPEAVATRLSYSEAGRRSKPVIYAESSGNHFRVRLRIVPDNLFKRIR
jgi:hypothetical protein